MKLKVCELFAGVGGFRLGLESTGGYEVVWSNQWEPSTKTQHASMVYEARFGEENHSNVDIEKVETAAIPDHDVLVGGFPCQDYSVATTLKNSKGLLGKKGVLWWSIHRILDEKKNKPKYLILENVDRLLKSPANQRGRDFAIMLKGLGDLGYAVEWRVVNAAEYGFPQRRRRFFLVAAHKSSTVYEQFVETVSKSWILKEGILANALPVSQNSIEASEFQIKGDFIGLSKNFNLNGQASPFLNSGLFVNGKISSFKTVGEFGGKLRNLKDILVNGPVSKDFFIAEGDFSKWKYLKGAKKEKRTTKAGYSYNYTEGAMTFPDALDKPSRTIITGEGGKSPSRFKHVIKTSKGLRRLTPIELERLNGFPDNHTELDGISDTKRAFFMGNALVIGVVSKIGQALLDKIAYVEK
ncbi:DNA (cytosine-5-)-methyltransferase [Croceivirga thetidis]|nr:DNA (cytosine-5-)-methyltransferase [Croceivirga thetidis]